MSIKCTRCGGELNIPEGQFYYTCTYCDTSLFVDRSKSFFHYWVNPTVDMNGAEGSMRRWMASDSTVAGLDTTAQVAKSEIEFFPFWRIVIERPKNEEIIQLPGAEPTVPEVREIKIVAGIMAKFNRDKIENINAFKPPDLTYEKLMAELRAKKTNMNLIKQISLVHIPIYHFSYRYNDWLYSAHVDGATGQVFAGSFPQKSDAPYALIAGGAFLILFLEGLLIKSLPLRSIVMAVTAIPIAFGAHTIMKNY